MNSQELSFSTGLWPQLCDVFVETFNILDGVNLKSYDYNMALLDQRLQIHKSRAFANNERLLFVLNDTEYYLPGQQIGFNLTNLFTLLYHLDISFLHCILVTNHHGIKKYVSDYCRSFGTTWAPAVFETNYSILQTNHNHTIDYSKIRNTADIRYHFCFLSNVKRDHRSYLRCYLNSRGLVEKTLLAWHAMPAQRPDEYHVVNATAKSDCQFITVVPFTRIRDKIIPSEELACVYTEAAECLNHSYRNPLIAVDANFSNFDAGFLKYSFVNLVAETVFDYPYPYLSEKTFKCFWELSPFIIIGATGSLAYLKQIGFKTFDAWFDESYDLTADPSARLTKIFRLIDIISKWSLSDCQEVYNQMKTVLEHNRQHYIDYFNQELLNKTIKAIKTNT